MSEIDDLWMRVCQRDEQAFGDWMGRVERPIRLSLARWARWIDAEGVVQEALCRMWLFAMDRGDTLTGEYASLRYAIGITRNIARNEMRQRWHEVPLPEDRGPDPGPASEPPDVLLIEALKDCYRRLVGKPVVAALIARIEHGHLRPDRELARMLGMTLNTFLQNIVRARRKIAECLKDKGIGPEELTT